MIVAKNRVWAASLAVTAVMLSMPAAGAEFGAISVGAVFEKCAAFDADAYCVARDALVQQGKTILPFLTGKVRSEDWRQWSLAEALILHVEKPEQVATWRQALGAWMAKLVYRDDGSVVVKLNVTPPEEVVVVKADAWPILVDAMRAHDGQTRTERPAERAKQILAHLAEPRTIDAMIHFGNVEALVKIGKPAIPALHRAVRRKAETWHEQRRKMAAAKALGQIGDQSSTAVLIEELGKPLYVDTAVACCQALGPIGTAEGAEIVFDMLRASAAGWKGTTVQGARPGRYYAPLRGAMLAFGQTGKGVLKKRAAGKDVLDRGIASGLLFEMAHRDRAEAFYRAYGAAMMALQGRLWWSDPQRRPDHLAFGRQMFWTEAHESQADALSVPLPPPLRIELALAQPQAGNVVALGRLKDKNLAFQVMAAALDRCRYKVELVLIALAELGKAEAVDVYRKLLATRRDVAYVTLVEAVVLLGEPKGAELLREMIRLNGTKGYFATKTYATTAALAKTVLPALEGDAEVLVKLLQSDQASVRRVAARALARKGDIRAAGVLLTEALAEKGPVHAKLRDAVVAMGKPAAAFLRNRGKTAKGTEKLACEALAVRIEKPELAAKLHEAGLVQDPGFMNRGGPTVATFQGAGKRVAKAVGTEAVPLLEATIVWRADSVRPGIAVFALAELKQERSIDVLVSQLGQVAWIRGTSLVAVALQSFGPKGIEAAKRVPPPDPSKARFASRVSRHRGRANTLTLAKDVKGVDDIIEGLQLAAAGKIETWRTNIYLKLAIKYDDKRLVEPVIEALDKQGDAVADSAMPVLCRYEDERIVPPCLKYLPLFSRIGSFALHGLVRAKGRHGVTEFLIRHARLSYDVNARLGAVRGMAYLITRRREFLASKDPAVDAAAQARREAAIAEALRDLLKDADRSVNTEAAGQLAQISKGPRCAGSLQPLMAWAEPQSKLPDSVTQYLAATKAEGVGPLLLTIYRRAPQTNYKIAAALARLKYEPAAGHVAAELDRRLAGKIRTSYALLFAPEMEILCNFGPSGCDVVHRVFQRDRRPTVRVNAAHALARCGYQKAAAETRAIFREYVAEGSKPGALKAKYKNADALRDYRRRIMMLVEAMVMFDRKQRAYPTLVWACLTTADTELRKSLSYRIKRLERDYKHLKQIPLSLG